jgi:hypothetical protein
MAVAIAAEAAAEAAEQQNNEHDYEDGSERHDCISLWDRLAIGFFMADPSLAKLRRYEYRDWAELLSHPSGPLLTQR